MKFAEQFRHLLAGILQRAAAYGVIPAKVANCLNCYEIREYANGNGVMLIFRDPCDSFNSWDFLPVVIAWTIGKPIEYAVKPDPTGRLIYFFKEVRKRREPENADRMDVSADLIENPKKWPVITVTRGVIPAEALIVPIPSSNSVRIYLDLNRIVEMQGSRSPHVEAFYKRFTECLEKISQSIGQKVKGGEKVAQVVRA